ncbi:hypothetical protein GCM10022261_11760 [Brevibacterium daeguense]|uniref:Uncharacterized protein n=1 Tax=Brevibacterium daeguense TaxID=909936 RepID=A0ABP8EI79_9MICO|nr:hypothetical protein [Brevibacterium daeguense]
MTATESFDIVESLTRIHPDRADLIEAAGRTGSAIAESLAEHIDLTRPRVLGPECLARIPTVPERVSALIPAGDSLVVIALGRRNREWVATWLREELAAAFIQDAPGASLVTVESTNRYLTHFPHAGSGTRQIFVVTAQDWTFARKYRLEAVTAVTAAELLSGAENVPSWALDQLLG